MKRFYSQLTPAQQRIFDAMTAAPPHPVSWDTVLGAASLIAAGLRLVDQPPHGAALVVAILAVSWAGLRALLHLRAFREGARLKRLGSPFQSGSPPLAAALHIQRHASAGAVL